MSKAYDALYYVNCRQFPHNCLYERSILEPTESFHISGGSRRCLGRRAEEEAASIGLGPRQAGRSVRGAARQDRDAQAQAQPAAGAAVAAQLSERSKCQGDLAIEPHRRDSVSELKKQKKDNNNNKY